MLQRLVLFLAIPLVWSLSSGIGSQDAKTMTIPPGNHWVDTWTAMPQLTEFGNLPPPPFNQTSKTFFNSTIRQTLHVSIPASHIRIQFSNAFGDVDLPITSATIANPVASAGQNLTGSSGINTSSLQKLTFSGNRSITIPPGAVISSDPVDFPVKANQIVSISIHLTTGQASQVITSHPGSRTSTYITLGDYTEAQNMTDPSTQSVFHWYFLSAVSTWQTKPYSSFSIIGDSITDGRGSDNNANNRWPDLLFNRMQRHPTAKNIAISNQAAGGNRVLEDGLGPSAVSRVERDVLAHPGVRYVMLFEGVNDIGTADTNVYNQTVTYNRLVQAYRQIITKVHSFGIPIFGATIAPFGCSDSTLQPYSNRLREETRSKVNAWIRSTIGKEGFDVLVDFDKVLQDPKNKTRLKPKYDLGDCLHPSVLGYEAMAKAFSLEAFETAEVDRFT